ncbi:hypothetical protein IMY05_015G0068400 [Salix suchowensis]|nr:hypothetical protein IMY05_015G0068400 [Salix suchowensis]
MFILREAGRFMEAEGIGKKIRRVTVAKKKREGGTRAKEQRQEGRRSITKNNPLPAFEPRNLGLYFFNNSTTPSRSFW